MRHVEKPKRTVRYERGMAKKLTTLARTGKVRSITDVLRWLAEVQIESDSRSETGAKTDE
jgi:hypothetical protein